MNDIHIERLELQALVHKGVRQVEQHSEEDVQGRLQFNMGQYITGSERRAWSTATDRESANADIEAHIRGETDGGAEIDDDTEDHTEDAVPPRGADGTRPRRQADCTCIHCREGFKAGQVSVTGGAKTPHDQQEEGSDTAMENLEAAAVNIPHASSRAEPTAAPFQPYYAWICVGDRENVDNRVRTAAGGLRTTQRQWRRTRHRRLTSRSTS